MQNPGEQDLLQPPQKKMLVPKSQPTEPVNQIYLGDTPKNAQSEFSFAAGAANGENTDRSRSNLKDFESAFQNVMKRDETKSKPLEHQQVFSIDDSLNHDS